MESPASNSATSPTRGAAAGTTRSRAPGAKVGTIDELPHTTHAPSPCSTRSVRSSATRSEEHTSELQSRPHLVCRLLLEKKKNMKTPPPTSGHAARPLTQVVP